MEKRIIQSQEEFDAIKEVKADEEVIFEASKIRIPHIINNYGILRLKGEIDSSWDNRYIVSRENALTEIVAWASSQVHNVARASSQVHNVAWESSQVHNEAWESSQVHNEARESSQVHNEAWENSKVHNVARASSQVHNVAWASSQVHNEAWENSQVHNEARASSQVHNVARASSQVHNVARENSQVHNVAWSHAVITSLGNCNSLELHGYAVAVLPQETSVEIKKDETCHVQRFRPIKETYLEREGIPVHDDKVVLYKRVSKVFLTQEGESWQTEWKIGATLEHPNWEPINKECGPSKFHACSRPYFCDEFRSKKDDRYIAIEIAVIDLYEWPNPDYPHKIAFRRGTVLYECNKYGKKIV